MKTIYQVPWKWLLYFYFWWLFIDRYFKGTPTINLRKSLIDFSIVSSVWPDGHIWPSKTMKIHPKAMIIFKTRLNVFAKYKIIAKYLILLPKWRNVAKSGHTDVTMTKTTKMTNPVRRKWFLKHYCYTLRHDLVINSTTVPSFIASLT